MYEIFEFLVNVFQSFIVIHFLIKCLGVRNNEKQPIFEYATGIMVTLIYLEILNRVTSFESIGIFIYLFISIFFSIFLLKGSKTEKVFYNLLMVVCIVFSSLLGGGIVGMFVGKDYFRTIIPYSLSRYAASILVQIILCAIFALILKLKKFLGVSDSKYMRVLSTIPVISVVICCLILYRDNQSYMTQIVYTMLAIIGVCAVNIVNLVLLTIEYKVYQERMQEKMLLNAYEQKEKDVESIKAIKIEIDKFRHEVKNILAVATELVDGGEYQETSDFLHKFIDTRDILKENTVYSNNIVLDYLLNRKINECEGLGIDIKYFVNGIIDGVEDVDLYILIENLIDNGIEASIHTSDKKMHASIYADEKHIEIEIGNSVKEDVLKTNPGMCTTKKNKKMHGYGLQNVRDVVQRYDGNIEYGIKMQNYLVCKIELNKTTIHV